jgi:hypothetical protein
LWQSGSFEPFERHTEKRTKHGETDEGKPGFPWGHGGWSNGSAFQSRQRSSVQSVSDDASSAPEALMRGLIF